MKRSYLGAVAARWLRGFDTREGITVVAFTSCFRAGKYQAYQSEFVATGRYEQQMTRHQPARMTGTQHEPTDLTLRAETRSKERNLATKNE
eukprot:1142147-Pelagomonas_calceolata.AAC.3